jgi:hypothetical protein
MGELSVADAHLNWGDELLGYATVLAGGDSRRFWISR